MQEDFTSSLQYCKSMAGMFQTVLAGCRVLHPGIEEFLERTKKLELQLQSTILTFSAFNESLKGLTQKTTIYKTGSSSDINQWLLMVTEQLNLMKYFLIELTRILTSGALNVRRENEESKKKIKILEKTHLKEYKTIKGNIRRKIDSVNKMKKRKEREHCADRNDDLQSKYEELRVKCKLFENQEKQAVRRACLEERDIFCSVASFIRRVMSRQSDIFKSINTKFDDSLEFIEGRLDQIHDIPDISLGTDQHFDFDTPATSVTGGSLRGSRCGSFSSLGASRPPSPLCIVEQGDLARGALRGSFNLDGQKKRKSQISSYCQTSDTLNEGVISSYSHPFYAQSNESTADPQEVRGQSCSPGPPHRRDDQRNVFSTIRRTRSPYRKHDLLTPTSTRRPPIPRKMQTESKMQTYSFQTDTQKEERAEGYAKMTQGSSATSVHSGLDSPSLAIVTSGATRVMSNMCVSGRRSRNLWSESILPDITGRTGLARSVSHCEDDKARYKCLSESLLQTLDSLSLSNKDSYVQGR